MAKLNVKSFTGQVEAKAYYLREVDRAAEAKRAAIITAAPGQSMTYEAKYQEALVGDGPFLQAEATALGMTVADVASAVLTARGQWETFGAQVEAARLKAKKQIRNSLTAAEMHEGVRIAFDGLSD